MTTAAFPPSALSAPPPAEIAPSQTSLGATTAQHAPSLRWASDLSQRLAWVTRFRGLLVKDSAHLESLICADIAKTGWEAFSADLLPLLAACRWHEKHASGVLAPRRVRGRPFWMLGPSHQELRLPVGHVAIIATWNYPVQLLGIQLLQALVAGNLVSVKPSENAPASQTRLLELALAAGLPEGVLEVWPATREAGPKMLAARRYDHIIFTGSTSVGQAVAEHAASRLTPSTLELSGHDSAIVLDDADPALAARCIWAGVSMNAGQTCMAPRRALVHAKVYARFLAALAPLSSGAPAATLIAPEAAARAFELARLAVAAGARSLSGVLEPPNARSMRPLAIVDCPASAELIMGRHFAPVLAVAPFDDESAALAMHQAAGQHLATSIFTRTPSRALALVPRLGASCITINDTIVPTAHPATSITGTALSGWGASRGRLGLLSLTRAVSVSTTSSRLRLPPEAPPAHLVQRLRSFMLRRYAVTNCPEPPPPSNASTALPLSSPVVESTSPASHQLASTR